MPFSIPTLSFNIIALVILASLLYPFLLGGRTELLRIVSIYRPLSLLFMSLNPVSILIAPFTTPAFLPVSSASILTAMAYLALEIRSSRGKSPPKQTPWIVFSLFVALVVAIELWWGFGQESPKNIGLMAALSAILIAWICFESVQAYVARGNLNYLFIVAAAFLAAIGVWIRAAAFLENTYDFESLVFFSDDLLFVTKAIAAAGFLSMSIILSQLYLDREWRKEVGSRKMAEENLLSMLSMLSLVRDEETGYHIKRTSEFVRIIAQNLKDRGALEDYDRHDIAEIMSSVAPLHDIGKIGIPDRILKKPGKLNQEEWEVMKTHSAIGEEVLKAAADAQGNDTGYTNFMMQIAADIAGGHHENWDGSGYPRGLIGRAIPQSARIMALADVYDALTSPRFYKQPWSHTDAITEIKRLKGSKFDPEIVDTFVMLEDEFKQIAAKYVEAE